MPDQAVLHQADLFLRDLVDAVVAGDAERFRMAFYEPGTKRVRHAVVINLPYGFADSCDAGRASFGELCLHHGRIEMMREALDAEVPDLLGVRDAQSRLRWYRHLCSRYAYGAVAVSSLGVTAAIDEFAQSREFVELHVEAHPNDSRFEPDMFDDDRARALVIEARMALRIRSVDAHAEGAGSEERLTAARRRQM